MAKTASGRLNVARDFSFKGKDGWNILGPGGGGALFSPAVSPHDANTMMMACDMTGTYITYNAGASWEMLNLDGRVDSIAFDPINPGVIYAGSGALFRSEDNGQRWRMVFPRPESVTAAPFKDDEALRVFETSDGLFPGGRIQKIYVDSENPGALTIGVSKSLDIGMAGGNLAVYASPDGGKTWRAVADVPGKTFRLIDKVIATDAGFFSVSAEGIQSLGWPNEAATRASFSSKMENPLFASIPGRFAIRPDFPIKSAAASVDPATGKTILYTVSEPRYDDDTPVGFRSGVYRSDDLAKTWIELGGGLGADFPGCWNGQLRIPWEVAVSRNNPDTVYLSLSRHPEIFPEPKPDMNYQGVMVSEDRGETWRWSVKMGGKMPDNVAIGWFEESYDTDWLGPPWYMSVSAQDPTVCLASCQGFAWQTRDGGETWRQCYCEVYEDGSYYGMNVETTNTFNVVFDPFDKDHLVFPFTDNGMLQSKNGGKTLFHTITGAPWPWVNTCYDAVFDPDVEGLIWSVWSKKHDLPRAKHFRRPFPVWQAQGGVCVSTNGGRNWTVADRHCDSAGAENHPMMSPTDGIVRTEKSLPTGAYTRIVLDPASPKGSRTLYIAGCPVGVFKSVDNGQTWVQKMNGVGENTFSFDLTLAADGALYQTVMKTRHNDTDLTPEKKAATDGAVYKSADGGDSWVKLTLPAEVTFPNKIISDPANPSRLYFTAWPDDAAQGGGVYRSDDGGASWECVFDQKKRAMGITIDPKHTDHVYITTFEHAAYRSLNGGDTWERIRGYRFKWGQNPVIDPHHDDMMYITTFGGGIFYGPKAGSDGAWDDIEDFIL